jgi:tRNA-modifying protein YgfZ
VVGTSTPPIILSEAIRTTEEPTREELTALREERAFVDLSVWRKVRVSGADARDWLDDLLTADIRSLAAGHATRTLLLSATGRVRADVHAIARQDDLVLVQAPDQPDHIGLLLNPYTLSSAVLLADATAELSLFAVPGAASSLIGHPGSSPSVLGAGIDVLAATGKPSWRVIDVFTQAGLVEAGAEAVEIWRIERGIARMGPDFDQGSLPAEAGLDDAIDDAKGCFVGQESVARIRNHGHPPRVLRHLTTEGDVAAGAPVLSGEDVVGSITSAADDGSGRAFALARVRWDVAERALALVDGRVLTDVGSSG